MANQPSANVLVNLVDLYRYAPTQDADAGAVPAYVLIASAVKCSIQPGSAREVVDDQDRITLVRDWEMYPIADYGLKPRDKIIYVDFGSVTHTIFVEGPIDMAGRGRVWGVTGTEKL
jgi:hypothetical protein